MIKLSIEKNRLILRRNFDKIRISIDIIKTKVFYDFTTKQIKSTIQ